MSFMLRAYDMNIKYEQVLVKKITGTFGLFVCCFFLIRFKEERNLLYEIYFWVLSIFGWLLVKVQLSLTWIGFMVFNKNHRDPNGHHSHKHHLMTVSMQLQLVPLLQHGHHNRDAMGQLQLLVRLSWLRGQHGLNWLLWPKKEWMWERIIYEQLNIRNIFAEQR